MNHPEHNLVLLLAGSGLSEREIAAAVSALRRYSPQEVAYRVTEVRRATRHSVEGWPMSVSSGNRPKDPHGAIARIEKLLRGEADLSVSEAADTLLAAIERNETLSVQIKPPNREAFAKWLDRVSLQVPIRRLLQYATQIRNSKVHRGSDWPLRERFDSE